MTAPGRRPRSNGRSSVDEVPVAFPNEEASAELIASRLRAEGIAARVDRGLWGAYQVPLARGQITVLVPKRDAARARRTVGTAELRDSGLPPGLRVGIALLLLSMGVAMVLTVMSFVM